MSRVVTLALRSLCKSRAYELDVYGYSCGVNAMRHSLARSLSVQAGSNAIGGISTDETKASRTTSEANSSQLDISYPAYMIWGANTGVGKTLVSAGLSASILMGRKAFSDNVDSVSQVNKETPRDVIYIKPVQTGYPRDSDARFVIHEVSNILKNRQNKKQAKVHLRNHTLKASPAVHHALNSNLKTYREDGIGMRDLDTYEEQVLEASQRRNSFIRCQDELETQALATNSRIVLPEYVPSPSNLTCTTMWSWFDPVSPHLAAELESATVKDSSILHALTTSLQALVDKAHDGQEKWAIIETAGGVASPGPSGTLQCDIYRPLRLPGVLVGDGKLGGISSTVSAFESLLLRGYDVTAVILLDSGLGNGDALYKYLQGRVPVLVLPPAPADPTESLGEWFAQAEVVFSQLQSTLEETHLRRIQRFEEMQDKAEEVLWWPFTQHFLVPKEDITVIDSRCGDTFSVHKSAVGRQGDVLIKQFDACASWWTQGPDAHMQSELARQVGYAAARYGHVMFPENVYEPALHCAELLLQGVGKGWARRVYFSDNGSTAIEIALKMAFRKFVSDRGLLSGTHAPLKSRLQLKVLALRGSYHGDTLGAMEAQAPSSFTGFLQQPWYSGRGLFLDPPTVHLLRGRWRLNCPVSFGSNKSLQDVHFESREDIFELARDNTGLSDVYRALISEQLSLHQAKEESDAVAALIIEPVIHAAGGMEMVDPLYQRILVHECQQRNIPVIFDEVFAGCWRLGVESAAELLSCYPDIACYAKLLTGGTIPLAVTLATEDVFEAFKGKSKLDALLHGHSYSAHALGCAAAATSLKYFGDPFQNSNLLPDHRLQEMWKPELVADISCHPSVRRVISLGTLFACELLVSPKETGYASTSTREIIQKLRKDGIYARPLGNVVYLMCGPLTPPQTCSTLLETLQHHLG